MQTCFYLEKKEEKNIEQWRQISCQYLLQNNVNPMSKWNEDLVFDADLQNRGCLSYSFLDKSEMLSHYYFNL